MPTQTITLPSKNGEPTWEIAERFPLQGRWTIEEFLKAYPDRGAEFVAGRVELLPVPNIRHQVLSSRLFTPIKDAATADGFIGELLTAGTRLLTPRDDGSGLREPDLAFLTDDDLEAAHEQYTHGALLAVEVVSPDDPRRDYETKRTEYAAAGVREYWIVDPIENRVLVLALDGDAYREHGSFAPGDTATGMVLSSLKVDVAALFA